MKKSEDGDRAAKRATEPAPLSAGALLSTTPRTLVQDLNGSPLRPFRDRDQRRLSAILTPMVATKFMIDPRSQGILDEMRLFTQTQNDVARHPLRISVIGVDDCAISDASGKLRLILSSKAQLVANVRAQTVGSDQEVGFVADLGRPQRQSD